MITDNSIFNFNPFSGEMKSDLGSIIVPQVEIEEILKLIESNSPVLIEFLGKQGRGKTTHLSWIASQMPEYPIFLLHSNSDIQDILDHESEVLFIDSIHHIPFLKRVALFRSKKTIIYTTHWSRKFDSLLSKKPLKTIRFKGIDTKTLKSIIEKRLSLASSLPIDLNEFVPTDEIQDLIKKNSDNYRGIINQLYDKFQL